MPISSFEGFMKEVIFITSYMKQVKLSFVQVVQKFVMDILMELLSLRALVQLYIDMTGFWTRDLYFSCLGLDLQVINWSHDCC